MGIVVHYAGCGDDIITFQTPLDVFSFLLSIGVLSNLKIVTLFFVKSSEQSELRSCTIESRLDLLIYIYV